MTTPMNEQEAPLVVSSASDFKKKRGVELKLPSGNVCLVKRADIMQLLGEGLFPDSFTSVITESISKAQQGPGPQDHLSKKSGKNGLESAISDKAMKTVLEDPAKLRELMLSFDKIVLVSVLEPKVADARDAAGHLIPDDQRNQNLVYTDEIDPDDKMFIFNFVVGGSSDLDSFREETSNVMASLQNG